MALVKKIALIALGLVVTAYAGMLTFLWASQSSLIYPGSVPPVPVLGDPPADLLPGFAKVQVPTPDGLNLLGWWHAPAPGRRGVVLYLHGNAGLLSEDLRARRYADIAAKGLGVLAIEYRGFGGSPGSPSETGLITDADGAVQFIHAHVPGARLALFGESLGTGVALATATRHPVVGVMLDSPYSSIAHVGQSEYPIVPVGLLLRDHWNSLGRVAQIHAPLLIAHCDADRTVPIVEGRLLFAAAVEPKTMITLPGCRHIHTWIEPVRSLALQRFVEWTGN